MAGKTITQSRVEVNDLDIAYLEAGEGPLVMCLHGFPDSAHGWESLLLLLAGAGYHAVAPFMRGYAPTAVPENGISPIGAWVGDANALHGALGGDGDAALIGHDWGALTTYGAAGLGPEKWRKIVTASIPPSAVMATRMFDYDQLKRFWYQYVFLQSSAEVVVANNDFEFITRLWSDWSPGYDATEALVHVRDALRGAENLTAALSTYRTMYDMALVPPDLLGQHFAALSPHPQPTLYLHGDADGCVPVDVVPLVEAVLPPGSQAVVIEGAGHFLQYEKPDRVNRLIVDFLAS